MLKTEVVFATSTKQKIVQIEVPEGTTLSEVVDRSGIAEFFREFDLAQMKIGVWNKVCAPDDLVKDGDRVEVYRPLEADPKEARRRRAQKDKD